jgi:hypothetical protein
MLPPPEAKGSQHFMYIPWLLVEAAQSISNIVFFIKKKFFEKDLMERREVVINGGL